jgi:FkbM family methyltransferase
VKEDLKFDYGNSVETILDCGANIGLSTLYYQRRFPQAKIISIEPEKRNYNLLIKNTVNYTNISTLENGVYGEDCDLKVVDIGEGEASYRTTYFEEAKKVLQTISCRSINSIMNEFGLSKIDILKMDIEGSEKECLFSREIEWLEKTRYFLVEIHENIYPGLKKEMLRLIPSVSKILNSGEYTIIVNNLK